MSRKIWQVNKVDKALAAGLAERHTLFPIAALIASSRGFDTDEKTDAFFSDELELSSPYELPDMEKAVKAINSAIDNFERIAVCGDYDADGITASTLLYSYLEEQGADVICRIPDRSEGYGLKNEAIDFFAEQGVKLIVTVDCGISSIDEAAYAASKGIKLVVTDHHRCGDTLPECAAVVDPYREDCKMSFKSFAGVGVAFKLVCALEDNNAESVLEQYSDIIALGTVGDVMPLISENRLLVRRGVEMINRSERAGIIALREAAGNSAKRITASGLAYTLVPRINAAGRMGSPTRALNLLLCEDEAICEDIAREIDFANVQRHKAEVEIVEEIKKKLADEPRLKYDRVLVIDGDGWLNGVIGIVAARLVDMFGKPCIVISRSGETAQGSGRSFEGFSLFEAIKHCESCLEHFGGHTLAAGVGIKSENIPLFRKMINEYAASAEAASYPVLKIDCRLNPAVINADLLAALTTLEPFGAGNPVPVFGLFGMKIESVQAVSEGRHIRLVLSKGGCRVSAMRFGVSPDAFELRQNDVIDCAVAVESNEYMGEIRPSIHVKAVRGTGMDDKAVLDGNALYEKIMRGEALNAEEKAIALPSREYMLEIFKYIKSVKEWKFDIEALCMRMGDNGGSYCKTAVALDAMLELGVLVKDADGVVQLPETTVKTDLNSSSILAGLK